MIKYCLGFMIIRKNENLSVVLIRKTHPEAQVGLLNGVGGVVKYNETSIQAIARECFEEINVVITDWKQIYQINTEQYSIDVFYVLFEAINFPTPMTMTDEIVGIYPIERWKDTVQDVPYFLDMIREDIECG